MRIVISSLRRSGSTIFWRCFRKASRALCFDEPFNPKLIQLPRPHEKGVYDEYIDLLKANSEAFWSKCAPIYPLDEISSTLRPQQSQWLQWLLERRGDVVTDTTRCWNKIDALAEVVGDSTYLIHLHRSPAGFAASHLLPSDLKSTIRGRWQLFKRRRNFFNLSGGFNYWNVEEITGHSPKSAYSVKILGDDALAKEFYSWKANARLLYFWKTAFNRVEQDGKAAFSDRFISISYEHFSRSPKEALTEIQERTGLPLDLGRLPNIKSSRSVFREGDPRWYRAAEKVGLPADRQSLFRLS